MKVILLADIKNVGKKDALLEVSEGYANNFLLKKGLALVANDKNLNLLKQKKGAEAAKAAREKQAALDLKNDINGKAFTLKMKAGEGGKLYGALTAADVSACLKKAGYEVDKRDIVMGASIKSVGTSSCKLKLYHDITADITINIEAL